MSKTPTELGMDAWLDMRHLDMDVHAAAEDDTGPAEEDIDPEVEETTP